MSEYVSSDINKPLFLKKVPKKSIFCLKLGVWRGPEYVFGDVKDVCHFTQSVFSSLHDRFDTVLELSKQRN